MGRRKSHAKTQSAQRLRQGKGIAAKRRKKHKKKITRKSRRDLAMGTGEALGAPRFSPYVLFVLFAPFCGYSLSNLNLGDLA
jgi:hypothetical protein